MSMNFGTEARPAGPMRHRIEVEYEPDEAPEWEAQDEREAETTGVSWQLQLERVERLLANVPHAPAPKGLAERILARIRMVMSEDMARLPAETHEAIAQAYALVMLSTLPVLLSASWAVAHTTRGEGEGMSSLLRQLTDILQSTAADLREMRAHKYGTGAGTPNALAPELVEMTMALIPLTVMKVFGESLRALQADLERAEKLPTVTESGA